MGMANLSQEMISAIASGEITEEDIEEIPDEENA
jgi:hypothetical protein